MQLSQVAAQLYTVRDYLTTRDDVIASMKKIRAIGYEAVQVSGVAAGAVTEEELVSILDGEGLICCATHEATKTFFENPEAVVERLQKLNCILTAVPSPGAYPIATLEDVQQYANNIQKAGEVLAQAGQILTYHNHHMEFRKVGGKTILDHIYDSTNPRHVQGEIDTYWVQYGGGDPVAWCHKLKNRQPMIHLKDFGITPENTINFCEIGQGNLDFAAIIHAAEAGGCQWFIVEQDTTPGDPFDSLKISFDYIKENLVA